MPVGELARGCSTATPRNVLYRTARIAPYVSGRWLDYGCAQGGYSNQLLRLGATGVVGVDIEADRIETAPALAIPGAVFEHFDGVRIPYEADSFDGAFVNEVLEHVTDEQHALRDIYRVLRPGAYLVVISPNRWFPFEGHTVNIAGHRFGPAPLIPWLPERLTRKWTEAHNYWPPELTSQVRSAVFAILEQGFIWPVLEKYPWLPSRLIAPYQSHIHEMDHMLGIRRFGVSTLLVAVRPATRDHAETAETPASGTPSN
jgi:SAM-dependent methyltransferase